MFHRQMLNGLFEHYRTLETLLGEKVHQWFKKMQHCVTPNNK